jgi:aspartate oxidase
LKKKEGEKKEEKKKKKKVKDYIISIARSIFNSAVKRKKSKGISHFVHHKSHK